MSETKYVLVAIDFYSMGGEMLWGAETASFLVNCHFKYFRYWCHD